MPAPRPQTRPDPAEQPLEPSADWAARRDADDAGAVAGDRPYGSATPVGDAGGPRPLSPHAPGSGWRGILIGVMAFALVVLVAVFIGLFELAGDDSTAPPSPVGSTPEGSNPLDPDVRPGAGSPATGGAQQSAAPAGQGAQ